MTSSDVFSIYDDRLSNFVYDNNWFRATDSSGNAWDDTLTYTSSVSNVTINFSGSFILLYGVIGQTSTYGNPTIRGWLDGTSYGSATLPKVNENTYGEIFFSLGNLSDGNHNLVIENSINGSTLFLDYFVGPPPSSSASSMQAVITVTATSTSPALMWSSNPNGNSHSTPVAAIVGGVVGGLTLLAAIAIAMFFYLRWRRSGSPYYYKSVKAADLLESETMQALQAVPLSTVTPFPQSDVSRSEHHGDDDRSSLYTTSTNPERQQSQSDVGYVYPPSAGPSSVLLSPSSSTPPSSAGRPNFPVQLLPSGKAGAAAQDAGPAVGLQHSDSGMRFGEAGPSTLPATIEAEVPPEYTER